MALSDKQKPKIFKRLPKDGDTEYTPIIWRKSHGEGDNRTWTDEKLKIGHIYDISTDEPGQELYFKAEFLGWKKEVNKYDTPGRPDYIYYVAIFKAIGYIEVEHSYSFGIDESD